MAGTSTPAAQQTLTVAQLTAQIKTSLEGEFPSVWVSGEISNYSRPQSGHSYFTLKDDQAQIRAVMWKSAAGRLKFDLTDGLDVICHGHIDVYAPRGSYQLVVDQLQPKGVGALELALRKLREKLVAEGLFDPARKRKLPAFPKRLHDDEFLAQGTEEIQTARAGHGRTRAIVLECFATHEHFRANRNFLEIALQRDRSQ